MIPLSDAELWKIQSIIQESRCWNESLRATFPATYYRIDEEAGIIWIGRHSHDYTYELEVRECGR